MVSQICRIAELQHLRSLKNLAVLSLEMNTIVQLPYYRYHVLYHLPSLKILDNREVNVSEVEKSQSVLDREESYLTVLFNRESICSMLERAMNNFLENTRYRTDVISNISTAIRRMELESINEREISDIWKMEDIYNEDDQEDVFNLFRREVRRVHQETVSANEKIKHRDIWEHCYNHVLNHQQTKLSNIASQFKEQNDKIVSMTERSLRDQNAIGKHGSFEEFRTSIDQYVIKIKNGSQGPLSSGDNSRTSAEGPTPRTRCAADIG